jgi:hypothetical protein
MRPDVERGFDTPAELLPESARNNLPARQREVVQQMLPLCRAAGVRRHALRKLFRARDQALQATSSIAAQST